MKGVLFSFLLLFSNWVLGGDGYQFSFGFLKQPPSFVLFNEVVRVPVQVVSYHKPLLFTLVPPTGVTLQKVSGSCALDSSGKLWVEAGACHLNLVIRGAALGHPIKGSLALYFRTQEIRTPEFKVAVIPHCPSMLNFPIQPATANQDFILNLKPHIKYYDENLKAKTPVAPVVTPVSQDGLSYDSKQQSIVGKPTRLGVYTFTVGANNSRCTAQPVPVRIEVAANLKDKPVFKKNTSMSAGIPKQKYTMNLLELVQLKAGYMVNNQVKFRLQPNMNNAPWLRISSTDATKLEGVVPQSSAGKTEQITLIASTNTGGDSTPLTVSIPIAFDPSQQPKVTAFALERSVGSALDFDITPYIDNPSNEPFELFIDKTEPYAPWLSHSKTALQGVVPLDVPGQLYQVTFHVSTAAGGSSKLVTIPLQVGIDKTKTPEFRGSINLPIAITEQSYFYDFNAHNDVAPNDIPYQIELAPDYPTPGWITIENNHLIIEQVPDISDPDVPIYVVIKNIPGGTSEVNKLYLTLFNRNIVTH